MIWKAAAAEFVSIVVVLCSIFAMGCAAGFRENLKVELARADEVKGTYTLFLYGGRFQNDLETVAILDKEGDQYVFEPYAPEFDYQVIKGLSAKQALDTAYAFVSNKSPDFYRAQLSSIRDNLGAVIGYEVRPLYQPFTYGYSDVLDIVYWITDSKVHFRVKVIPPVRRSLEGDSRPFTFRGMGW